jgi:hypothetical protein
MDKATDVIVFFVGLTLWSQQIPNDCGVKAILPRVEHTTGKGSAHSPAASPSPISVLPIPKHQAAIVFPKYSYLSQNGWGVPEELPGQTLTNDSGKLLFVRLNGDTVHFLTNQATNVPADMTGMKLARVREQLCPAKNALRPEYQHPYSGAAAVVALPEGTLQACLSVPAESLGRLDTRVSLKTIDTLGISGSTLSNPKESNTKELRLKPRSAGEPIQLMIVNVPETFFNGSAAALEADGVSHMNVYLAMGEPGTAACALSLQQWWDQLDPDGIPLCNPPTSATARAAFPVSDAMLSVWISGANFECSNTQWP